MKIRLGITLLIVLITSIGFIGVTKIFVTESPVNSVLGVSDFDPDKFVFPDSVYNYPYGEIIIVYRSGVNAMLEVFNTTGVEEYSNLKWSSLDANQLAQELGVQRVVVNSPKYWVVDSIEGLEVTNQDEVYEISTIKMQKVNEINAGRFGNNLNQEAYAVNTIDTNSQFTWNAGTEVYELTSSSGDIFRMQSYSQVVDSSINIDNLETLGFKLDLPEGWTYDSYTLDETFTFSKNKVEVLVDEFGNTYQSI